MCLVPPGASLPARKIVIMPLPITEDWDWQLNAACHGIDSTLFFIPTTNVAKLGTDGSVLLNACVAHALSWKRASGMRSAPTSDTAPGVAFRKMN